MTACSANQPVHNSESDDIAQTIPIESETERETESLPEKTGIIAEQILNGDGGEIHYSYYLPEGYDQSKTYPLVVTMPGYDMMWFGKDSSGSNLNWKGFRVWTELSEDMIVVNEREFPTPDAGKTPRAQKPGAPFGICGKLNRYLRGFFHWHG